MSYLRRSGRKRKVPSSLEDSTSSSTGTSTCSMATNSQEVNTLASSSGTQTGFAQSSSAPLYLETCNNRVNVTLTSLGAGFGAIAPTIYSSPGTSNSVNTVSFTPAPVLSVTNEVSATVPQNLKEKIIRGDYIELFTLLNNSHSHGVQKLVLSNKGEIVVQSNQNSQKLLSIDQWTTAFIIFTSIFCSVHSHRFQELLKYMYVVRQGASRSTLGWITYDEQYRLRKSINPSSSWADVDMELWLLYMNGNSSTYFFNSQHATKFQNSLHSNLKCYPFNYSNKCTRQTCMYSHTCLRCNENHPVASCRKNAYISNQGKIEFNGQYNSVRRPVRIPKTNSHVLNSFRVPQQFSRPRVTSSPMGLGVYPN